MLVSAAATSAQLDISGNTIARNGYGITAAANGDATIVNAAGNVIVNSAVAGISALNPGTRIRASGNAVFRGQYGVHTPASGSVYSPGNNYVHDNATLDDSTHTADSLL